MTTTTQTTVCHKSITSAVSQNTKKIKKTKNCIGLVGWTWLLGNVGVKRKLAHEYFREHTRMEMAFGQKVHNNFIKQLQQLKIELVIK